MSTFRALLHPQILSGPWQLFVVLDGPAATWPEHVWPDDHPTPTPAARLAALAGLGYRPVPGAEWEWTENAPEAIPVREVRTVRLLAAVTVEPIGGEPQ
jgi:hypothetical protein